MISQISLLIMAAYTAATILISYLVNKNREKSGSFSTGNRQFGWKTVGVSILATYISAMTFIGMPGWVYNDGMQALQIHLNYPIVIFFTTVFFIPLFHKLNIISIYEYLEHRFGVTVRTINSITFLIVQCISSGIILYTVSLIITRVLPISIEQAIIITSIFTAIYTYSGGITTVIWTDVMQSAVLLIGSIALFFVLTEHVNDLSIINSFPDKLTAINTSLSIKNDTTIWSGLIAMSFLHLSVYGTNQLVIQRTLATRSVDQAQKSMLVCGYGAFFIYLFFSLTGLLLFCFYDGQAFENSNNIILDFVFNHTNPVIVGLVMSALLAAAMSTLDSSYNSMATVSTFDIYKRFFKKDGDDEHYEKISRRLSLSCSALIVIPSILAVSNESVLKSVASLVSIFVGIRLGSFLLGLFCKSANETGAIAASIVSILSIVICRYLDISWPWYALVGTATFLMTGYLTSQYFGVLSNEQKLFIVRQKGLYSLPNTGQYMLLVFGFATILFTKFIPDMILFIFN